jgi:hypothetical protein
VVVGFRPVVLHHRRVRIGQHDPRLGPRRPHQVHQHRVALLDAALFHRLVARGALAQPRNRLVHRRIVHRHGGAAQLDRGVVPRIDRRHRVEARRELQRLPFLDDDVLDVRRVDRLDAALAERLVDGARDQPVCHIVQDLVAKALAHDLRGDLPGPEAWDAGRLPVVARDLVYLRINRRAVDFHHEVLACFVDVDEFGLHSEVSGFQGRAGCPFFTECRKKR